MSVAVTIFTVFTTPDSRDLSRVISGLASVPGLDIVVVFELVACISLVIFANSLDVIGFDGSVTVTISELHIISAVPVDLIDLTGVELALALEFSLDIVTLANLGFLFLSLFLRRSGVRVVVTDSLDFFSMDGLVTVSVVKLHIICAVSVHFVNLTRVQHTLTLEFSLDLISLTKNMLDVAGANLFHDSVLVILKPDIE